MHALTPTFALVLTTRSFHLGRIALPRTPKPSNQYFQESSGFARAITQDPWHHQLCQLLHAIFAFENTHPQRGNDQ